ENRSAERDQPFLLGATNIELPSYKACYVAILKQLHELGASDVRGHLLFALSDVEFQSASAWVARVGLTPLIAETAQALKTATSSNTEGILDKLDNGFMELWQTEAGMKTYGQAVADIMAFRAGEGEHFSMTVDEWLTFANTAS